MRIRPYDTEIANIALARNDFDFLFKYCAEEIERHPDNWEPYHMLGTVYSLLFITEKKIEHVEKAIEYHKKALDVLGDRLPKTRNSLIYALGMNYKKLGRLDLAKTFITQAKDEPHLQGEVRVNLLEIALKERDRAEAERLFNLLPDDFERYYKFDLPYIDKPALRKLIDDTFGKQ